ncbi:cell division FtsK/SpoIIIE [Segniliparus rotundus DSM 44985]|uniref:Cell division FtsK/SpoIIIE n=1 Tax=Segniliparus rotundus (strain ATCC BAA-972 / CDC 1076 / CIP 108378 / DSM 44985 / JCM 13578) TaxID=640132 RepID=D6Z8Y3_SEGRD|nr:FtsK/SpoIIIE domain-containing protein [Segniliparus rotundus]ADG98413.1 cell division FtsK/SpoIIIE [Segniliparus rotundus DSM 44985]
MANNQNNKSKEQSAGDALFEDVLTALFHALFYLLKWAVLFPAISAPVILSLVVDFEYGVQFGAVTAWVLLCAYTAWGVLHPVSFRSLIWWPVVVRYRKWSRYERRWAVVTEMSGLTAKLDGKMIVPKLRRIAIAKTVDTLTVGLLAGQSVADWQRQSDALGHTFGASRLLIRSTRPGEILIQVHRADLLAKPVPVPAPQQTPDLAVLPVGVTESGKPWTVSVLGRHVLVAGATGAGKGSVLWSVLVGASPAIWEGLAQVWVIDPKGGMEFGAGEAMFARFAHDNAEGALALLRDAARTMVERAGRMRGRSRQHVPTKDEPLILLLVDELASLTAYQTDRKVKTEMEQLLGLVLTQGRAVGVVVLAAAQDPSKDTLAMRQLFPTRIALRLSEPTQAAMVLGQSARDRGAMADLIPESTPGVGYVQEEERAEPVRVRAFHVSDAMIDRLARAFATKNAKRKAGGR